MKANTDTYRGGAHDGEQRLKFVAAKMLPYSYSEENKMLLKRLKIYARKDEEHDAIMS